MREAGLFRMFTPRGFVGLEADPVIVARVADAVAESDGAAAWALQAASTQRLSPEAASPVHSTASRRWRPPT